VRFPVDVVKIDRSFVAGLFDARPDRVVVEAILRLSNELGLRTVAEGVETNAQAMALRSLGCTIGQGFLFSPAVEADLLDWNKRYSCLRAE
jgi:EAL domain-containing protein (putative c-di-GMP-specific phosphodiesterase class I)